MRKIAKMQIYCSFEGLITVNFKWLDTKQEEMLRDRRPPPIPVTMNTNSLINCPLDRVYHQNSSIYFSAIWTKGQANAKSAERETV